MCGPKNTRRSASHMIPGFHLSLPIPLRVSLLLRATAHRTLGLCIHFIYSCGHICLDSGRDGVEQNSSIHCGVSKYSRVRIGSFPASEPASNSIRRLPQFGCMTKHESLQATSFFAFNLYSDSKKVFTASKRPAKKKSSIRVSTNTRVYCTLIVHGS